MPMIAKIMRKLKSLKKRSHTGKLKGSWCRSMECENGSKRYDAGNIIMRSIAENLSCAWRT